VEALPLGAVVGGVYQIGRILGRGGFAITYLGRDRKLGSLVAIKEFLPERLAVRLSDGSVSAASSGEDATFAQTLASFVAEAQRVAALHHPGVVQVIRLEEEQGTAYLVMPYFAGETLQARHERRMRERCPWEVAELVTLLRPVSEALTYVHGLTPPLLHRDLKPDNVFLVTAGGQERALLLDFGAARQVLHTTLGARRPTGIWTPGFAPIEQVARTEGAQTPATDVYGLAATLYYLLTDRLPVDALDRLEAERAGRDPMPPVSAMRSDIAPEVSAVLQRGCALRRAQRYPTIDAFLTAFQDACQPLAAPPPPPPEAPYPPKRKLPDAPLRQPSQGPSTVVAQRVKRSHQLLAVIAVVVSLFIWRGATSQSEESNRSRLIDSLAATVDTTPAGSVISAKANQNPFFVAMAPITGVTHEVKMIGDSLGYRFDLAYISIKQGDGIRFALVSGGPHNVAFNRANVPNEGLAQLAANMPEQVGELSGKMLITANETYTISLAGVARGTYTYYCTAHAKMGMIGTFTVE
jgi:plastocyanin